MSHPFPCHPEIEGTHSSERWRSCPKCGTLVRAQAAAAHSYNYSDDYPVARGHHDPAINRCKVRTLERWLAELGLSVSGKIVCEIGFGGAGCLSALQTQGATVFGLEPVAANRTHAQQLGVPADHIFDVNPLPNFVPNIDLWLFQDSFEHVPDPNALTSWMAGQSAPRAQVLLVAPDAMSLSRKLMGRWWLHQVPDHWIHYSQAGIANIFGRAGFRIVRRFRPLKFVSLGMAWRHLRVWAGRPAPGRESSREGPRFWFNLGEMGLLLERNDDRR